MSSASGSGRQQPLLAARATKPDDGYGVSRQPGQDPRQPASRPKRTLIESACSACRKRKSRCDGARPSCARCITLHTECAYEAEEGESRWSALRRRNQILETERSEARELMHYLQTRPEHEALEIFQRIRSGTYEDLFGLLRQLRQNDAQLPPNMNYETAQQRPPFEQRVSASSSGGSVGDQQRLPPIRSMFEVSDVHAQHQHQQLQQQQLQQQQQQHQYQQSAMNMAGAMQNPYGQQQEPSPHSMSSRERGSHSSSEHPFTSGP